jgi:YidC/Oxa1 family membrane protein insertase
MVVFFGWQFASGPVIYWVTQSNYSVVQQWFITGWGSMKDWVPQLPDLPEHKRLGFQPPRNFDDVVVVTGEGAPPKSGAMGWLQKRMEEAQAQQAARANQKPGSSTSSSSSSSSDESKTPKGPRPLKKDSPLAKSQRQRERAAAGSEGSVAAESSNGQSDSNGARPRSVPRRSRPTKPSGDS